MKKILGIFYLMWGAVCWGQTPTPPLNDPNWQLQWYDDFTPTTGSKVWTKSSGHLTCAGCTTATQQMDVQDNNDHGGEPLVNLDANTTIGTDFSNTSDPNNYLRFQAIKQDYTCANCDEHNHHYSGGGASFWGVQYGYLELKAKISNTYANWAAFWLWDGTYLNNMGGASGSLYSYDPNPNNPTQITNVSTGTANLYAGSIIDYQNGYVVGSGGTVLKSTNLAPQHYQTWTQLTSTAFGTGNLNSVCFTNINTGYIVGGVGKVIYTGDAGTSWSSQTLTGGGVARNLNSVCFPWANYAYSATIPNSNTGYVVGDGGYFYSTTDGSTWSLGTNISSYNLKSVASTDMPLLISGASNYNGNVYAVGGDATHGVFYYNSNFGSGTWTSLTSSLPVTTKCLNSISFSDAKHCFIAGNGGTLIEGIYTSGAWSWNNLSSSITGTPNLYSLSFMDVNTGYVVGASGTVYKISNINNGSGSAATVTNLNPSSSYPFGTSDFYFTTSHYDYDEMDVFEQAAGTCNGDQNTAYYGKYNDKNTLTCNTWVNTYNNSTLSGGTVGNVYPINDFSQWHTYGIEWSPSTVTYYIDNQISRITPNPGYQPSTGTGNFLSQSAFVVLNLNLSGFVKWNDSYPSGSPNCSLDWPGATNGTPNCSSCVGSPSGITKSAGYYDPNYVHTTGGCGYNYSDYFNPMVANNVPSGQVGYPAPSSYEGYPSSSNGYVGTSFNQTSFNVPPTVGTSVGGTPFMLIDHLGYWKLKNGTPGTGSCWTGVLNYKDLSGLNGFPNQPQSTITVNPGQTGGSNITTNSSSPAIMRASSYIEIDGGVNGEFTTGSGIELLLDVSACY